MTRRVRIGILVVICTAVCVAGGLVYYFRLSRSEESNAEVAARYKERLTEKRAQLHRISMKLPPPRMVTEMPPKVSLEPVPRFDVNTKEFNIAFVALARCIDPESRRPAAVYVGLQPTANWQPSLIDDIYLVSDKSEFASDDKWKAEPGSDWVPRLEENIARPYLVIYRLVDDESWWKEKTPPKEATLEIFVVDLRTESVIGGFAVTHAVAAYDRDGRMIEFNHDGQARFELTTGFQKKVAEGLEKMTSGRFVLDSREQ